MPPPMPPFAYQPRVRDAACRFCFFAAAISISRARRHAAWRFALAADYFSPAASVFGLSVFFTPPPLIIHFTDYVSPLVFLRRLRHHFRHSRRQPRRDSACCRRFDAAPPFFRRLPPFRHAAILNSRHYFRLAIATFHAAAAASCRRLLPH
jgi:hypothetical protein